MNSAISILLIGTVEFHESFTSLIRHVHERFYLIVFLMSSVFIGLCCFVQCSVCPTAELLPEVLRRTLQTKAEAPQKLVKVGPTERCLSKRKTQTSETFFFPVQLFRLKPCQPSDITDESLSGAASTAESTTWRFRESDVIKVTGAESCG